MSEEEQKVRKTRKRRNKMTENLEEKHEALDLLFSENNADTNKNQDYKKDFKEFDLPNKYFLMEMYSKQKELQSFLASKGKTKQFPDRMSNATQKDIELAIYHLFCMQVEHQELKVELAKIIKFKAENAPDAEVPEDLKISARYELIDIFFFMFNVGIYSGLDIIEVINAIEQIKEENSITDPSKTYNIEIAIENLLNYIDKLPWKAWKEYDYNKFYQMSDFDKQQITNAYAKALHECITWGKIAFNETDKSLFDLYMNKWVENKRRQEDINSGYVLNKENIEENKETQEEQNNN